MPLCGETDPYLPTVLPMLGRSLDWEVQCTAVRLDHARDNTYSKIHCIEMRCRTSLSKARSMISLALHYN